MRRQERSLIEGQRKLAAIMFTDMVGFMAIAQENESLSIELLEDQRRCVRSIFPRFNGKEIKTLGDGFLIEFLSALEAVHCAIALQKKIAAQNKGRDARKRYRLRIGIHLGEVVWRNGDVYGNGVNLAARMEPLARPGGICFTQQVYEQVRGLISENVEFVPKIEVKNDAQRRDIYRISFGYADESGAARPLQAHGKSVAVLPFVSLSPGRENEFLSDGITEDLITALSQINELRVPAGTSVFAFKGKTEDIRQIGAQLAVSTVVEGIVRRDGNKLRVTAKLINVADGFNLWSERYDREVEDIFRIQDEITRSIVHALRIRLAPNATAHLVQAATENTEAYELYVRGRHFWNQRGEGLKRSVHYFELALIEDTKYALAYAGLAEAHLLLAYYGYSPATITLPLARKAASQSLALNANLGEAHCALGFLAFLQDWDWSVSAKAFRKAIDLKPGNITAYYWFSSCLLAMDRGPEALEADKQALDKDPLSVLANAHLAWTLVGLRENTKALQQLKRTLALDRKFVVAHRLVGQANCQLERYEEAIASFGRAVQLSKRSPSLLAWLAYAFGRSGRRDDAQKLMDEMFARAANEFVRPFLFSLAYTGLGKLDYACEWLQKAFDGHDLWMPWLHGDPAFDPLRSEPAFATLLRSIAHEMEKPQRTHQASHSFAPVADRALSEPALAMP
jgi:TolB-like protein/class 3 adenylate cyclase